jgi:hypothetical protein
MKFRLKELNKDIEKDWSTFVDNCDESMIYFTISYKRVIENFLNMDSNYQLVVDDSGLNVAVFPLFIKRTEWGSVANSLPFYGSNGGLLFGDDISVSEKEEVIRLCDSYLESLNLKSSTIVTSPYSKNNELFVEKFKYSLTDYRIGQITYFPEVDPENEDDIESAFFQIFHYKTRNMVRKALKNNFSIQIDNSIESFKKLHEVHVENMEAIGGLSKPFSFFKSVFDNLTPREDFDIYVAKNKEENFVSGLLILKHNKTIEYFTPVTKVEYRNQQPLSAIIFQVMIDAFKDGYKNWNWGGTWGTQEGVYRFKNRFGAKDVEYKYLINVFDEEIYNKSKEFLLTNFQYFFTVPFNKLNE